MTVGPADVGRRVVVRRRLPGGQLGDLLGELRRCDAGGLAVQDRHGELHEVAAGDVVAAKLVPPAPVRRPVAP